MSDQRWILYAIAFWLLITAIESATRALLSLRKDYFLISYQMWDETWGDVTRNQVIEQSPVIWLENFTRLTPRLNYRLLWATKISRREYELLHEMLMPKAKAENGYDYRNAGRR